MREFMKWDYELRHAEQVETVIDRALAISKSEPQGPVYVTLPREVLGLSIRRRIFHATRRSSRLRRRRRTRKRWRKPPSCSARRSIRCSSPRTAAARWNPRAPSSSSAQTLAVPVIHYRPRHLALSTEHPMHCGWDPHALLKEADVVLVVDCDVPWIPKEGQPKPEAKIIHIGPDPLFARYPLRGFRTDLALTGAVAPTLQALWRAAQKQAVSVKQIEERRRTVSALLRCGCARKRAPARSPCPRASPANGSRPASTSCSTRTPSWSTSIRRCWRRWSIKEPGRYFGNPSAGGLGWGMGAALGAKLASPEKTVICAVGDGAYMFGNPTRGALRVGGDAPAGAVHHRQQRSLGGGAPLDPFDLSEGFCCRNQGAAVRHARALAALRARGARVRRPRRARQRAAALDARAREGAEGREGGEAPGAC